MVTRKPLEKISKTCLRNGRFPLEWKKANAVPIHKKSGKQTNESYRPDSLLPICGKIFECLLYDTTLNIFPKNNPRSSSQSGSRPWDSCMNQLLSITHEILYAFDMGLEVRGILRGISKAFVKVWDNGLIFKLRQNGIYDEKINI